MFLTNHLPMVQLFKDKCNYEHEACTDRKKECKKERKRCKRQCDEAPKCCEDNRIPGFGTFWCELNKSVPGWCNSAEGTTKCKKTCGLCE